MRRTLRKSLLAALLALLVVCMGIPVYAAPTADPDFVEITLDEFKVQNPDYTGIADPRDEPAVYAVENPGLVTSYYNGPFEWVKTGTKWYLYANGGSTKVTRGGWYQDSTTWYFLYPVGVTTNNGVVSTGEMAVGWEKIGGHWYYFSAAGVMQKDWYQISTTWYYMRTAAETVNGRNYPEGSMVMGAQYLNSSKGSAVKDRNYYFDANGAMVDWYYPLYDSYDPFFITSGFAIYRPGINIHNGMDLRAQIGTIVESPCTGEVLYSAWASGMGNVVIIKTNVTAPNNNKLIVRCMHLDSMNVEKGASIVPGTYIAKSGTTGTDAAHFHIDVNALNITTREVTHLTGQNPAAFFTTITWDEKGYEPNPYGPDLNGYIG